MHRMEIDNLAKPIVLDDTEVVGFLRSHRCGLCGGVLNAFPFPEDHKWIVKCEEHGEMYSTSVTSLFVIHNVKFNRHWADRELNPEPPKSTNQILKDLGF